MSKLEIIKKLRNKESIRFFNTKDKTFVHIQLNKQEKRICWERWVSKDKRNWVNQNYYLDMKSVLQVVEDINKQK